MRINEIVSPKSITVGQHPDGTPITLTEKVTQLTVTSTYGHVKADIKNDAVVVTGAAVYPQYQSQGAGTDLYQAMALAAFDRDKVMISDSNVTNRAAKAWRRLATRGITVIENFVPRGDQVGQGGSSALGWNPFVAVPADQRDLTYAEALSLLYPPALRSTFLVDAEDINLGSATV